MPRMQFISVAALTAVTGLASSIATASITIPTVPIGNPGNAPDPLTGNRYGSVAYSYSIGQTEVTNAQYLAFLNAVAATDTNNLYNPEMAGPFGGITRSGSAGQYAYETVGGRENNPVTFVSFSDAMRFTNWLHNGQPSGSQNTATTERGVYNVPDRDDSSLFIDLPRSTNARWALPSEDEWYKAAYHQPASQGGDSDNYWLYPTSSNIAPTTAQANFDNPSGFTSAVGSYAANYYGVFDMAANVFEWTDTRTGGPSRPAWGSSFLYDSTIFRSDLGLSYFDVRLESADVGFRVVQVPSPAGGFILLAWSAIARRRRR